MCLGGILWSNIRKTYYGCRCSDTDAIGFRDDIFYDYLNGSRELLTQQELGREACLELFREYAENPDRTTY